MSNFDIFAPELPESVLDATIAIWHKQEGDQIERDEIIVEIETDKVILDVPANQSGRLKKIICPVGTTISSRQCLAQCERHNTNKVTQNKVETDTFPNPLIPSLNDTDYHSTLYSGNNSLGPAARRLLKANTLSAHDIKITHDERWMNRQESEHQRTLPKQPVIMPTIATEVKALLSSSYRNQNRVPMTRIRKKIAERLLETKNNMAMLTTFNEVNMAPITNLRKQYSESFEKTQGVKLGFMPFYIKAALNALKRYPKINAAIDGDDIIYHNYFDISIAVSTERGLVTPVLRDVDSLTMLDIEKEIKALANKAREGKLTIEELTGGSFTITNGGVFGSLMSTPLINPPQSAILGLHMIKDRPMVVKGEIVILPMMYLALSYDHRLIDGKEAVNFLVTIKDILEDPAQLLFTI